MATDQFDDLLKRMLKVAEAVNAFKALVDSIGIDVPEQDDARGVRGTVPWTAAIVYCSKLAYVSPFAAHAKRQNTLVNYGEKWGKVTCT